MGLLNQMWDDTLGGPLPDKGVGKLRKLDIPSSPRFARSDSAFASSPRSSDSPMAQSPMDESGKNLLDRRLSAEFQRNQDEARRVTQSIAIAKQPFDRSTSLPSTFSGSPRSPGIGSPSVRREDNVWRTVFHPGSNKAGMDRVGSGKWDKAEASSPTVYDWMYSKSSKSEYR